MPEKEKGKKQAAKKEAAAKKPPAGKPAAKKPVSSTAKTAAEEKRSAAKRRSAEQERAAAERAVVAEKSAEERAADETARLAGEEPRAAREAEREENMSEEEFRRLVEESLEKVTVADVVLNTMNQMASLGYLKMGLPESVNLKYRDLEQAALAIDALEGLIKGTESRIPQEALRPFRGTLANLQLNYVQLVKRSGGD